MKFFPDEISEAAKHLLNIELRIGNNLKCHAVIQLHHPKKLPEIRFFSFLLPEFY